MFFIIAQEPRLLSDVCLGCICEVTSGCNNTIGCYDAVCGPFAITWGYWSDSGRPTVNDESSSNDGGELFSLVQNALDIYPNVTI